MGRWDLKFLISNDYGFDLPLLFVWYRQSITGGNHSNRRKLQHHWRHGWLQTVSVFVMCIFPSPCSIKWHAENLRMPRREFTMHFRWPKTPHHRRKDAIMRSMKASKTTWFYWSKVNCRIPLLTTTWSIRIREKTVLSMPPVYCYAFAL